MPIKDVPIDFIAYGADGSVVLLAEAKSRYGTSKTWAAKLRRNMLAHGVLPRAKYFLIATPERIYGWGPDSAPDGEILPHFTADAQSVLGPYFARLKQDPANITPEGFEVLLLNWLTDIARSSEYPPEIASTLRSLPESGLVASLRHAQIEMNHAG